jgi:hypothetical protein
VDEDSADRVRRYRNHASEIFAVAEDITHPPSRAALLRLAETYERLAARIESEFKNSRGELD